MCRPAVVTGRGDGRRTGRDGGGGVAHRNWAADVGGGFQRTPDGAAQAELHGAVPGGDPGDLDGGGVADRDRSAANRCAPGDAGLCGRAAAALAELAEDEV